MTLAEMTVPSIYAVGDTVIFNRPYKILGVAVGDERTVAGIDRMWDTVRLEDGKGD